MTTNFQAPNESHAQQEQVTATSADTAAKAQAEARGRYRALRRAAVKIKLNCLGDPSINAKSVIEVRGIGELLSGLYYVEDAKHNVGQGYSMTLTCRRDGSSRARERVTVDESTQGPINAEPAETEPERNQLTPRERSDPDQVGGTAVEYLVRTDGGRQ